MNNPMPLFVLLKPLSILGSALLLLSFSVGCSNNEDDIYTGSTGRGPSMEEQSRTHLDQGIDFLVRMDEFQPDRVRRRIQEDLNQWILRIPTKDLAPDWIADRMFGELPPRYDRLLAFSKLDEKLFLLGIIDRVRGIDDVQFLRDALVARNISSWVSELPIEDASMQQWLEEISENDPIKSEQLGIAYRLFDWTIRNVQLDALPSWTDEVDDTSADPIPGGRFDPVETLRLGHGDALERARLFIALSRQQGLTVVMLARDVDEGFPHPWAAALLLNDDLYLFEPTLGLPLPGENDRGIVTLAQLVESPSLLRQLDVENLPSPIEPSDLQEVVALIDAEPTFVSQRMRALESRLVGDRKMTLSIKPMRLASQLKAMEPISDAQLWLVPLEVILYRARLSQDSEAWTAWLEEYWSFLQLTPFSQARAAHFRGELDSTETLPGAKRQYMDSRPTSQSLETLTAPTTAEELLRATDQMPIDVSQRREAIANLKQNLEEQGAAAERIKRAASYYLGLATYDSGEVSVAASLFRGRVIEATPDSRWIDGANYNLARSYELLASRSDSATLYQQAIELYRSSDTPQRHGNLIRARRLEARLSE